MTQQGKVCAQGSQYLDPSVCHPVTETRKRALADYQTLSSSSFCYIQQHLCAKELCGDACIVAHK